MKSFTEFGQMLLLEFVISLRDARIPEILDCLMRALAENEHVIAGKIDVKLSEQFREPLNILDSFAFVSVVGIITAELTLESMPETIVSHEHTVDIVFSVNGFV